MSGIVLLILRIVLAGVLYAFLGWILLTLWRDLKQQGELLAARQPTPLFLTVEGARTQRFTAPEVLIGRDPTCDLRLGGPTVSGRHARLRYRQGQWWLEDLRSTNGTFLHDEPIITATVVTQGDTLRCGQVTLQVGEI